MRNNRIRYVTFSIALIINLLVLINNFLHNPEVGYDAQEHLDYITTLPYHLPTVNDTAEYYSPPLPYFLPSLVDKIYLALNPTGPSQFVDGKFAQFLNLLLSIGITILFLKLAELLRPGNEYFKISLLGFWGILTVYYKTFAQVRGEPYVAFFAVLVAYQTVRLIMSTPLTWWKEAIPLGLALGCLVLSRQWGVFLLPALPAAAFLVLLKDRSKGWELSRIVLPALVVALFASGWYFLHNYLAFGSIAPYGMQQQPLSLSNRPPTFFSKGFNNPDLYTSPTRGTFNNQLVPVFYSDTWGDYWGYWVFIREKTLSLTFQTSRPKVNLSVGPIHLANLIPLLHADGSQINAFLGRVNLVSLLPSLLLVAGFLTGLFYIFRYLLIKPADSQLASISFIALGILFSLIFYFWYLLAYTDVRGITVKATYMIQVFMLLPILGAEILELIRAKNRYVYAGLCLLLLAVFLIDFPVLITRYWWFVPSS